MSIHFLARVCPQFGFSSASSLRDITFAISLFSGTPKKRNPRNAREARGIAHCLYGKLFQTCEDHPRNDAARLLIFPIKFLRVHVSVYLIRMELWALNTCPFFFCFAKGYLPRLFNPILLFDCSFAESHGLFLAEHRLLFKMLLVGFNVIGMGWHFVGG